MLNRENVQWLIEKSGVPFDFDMLVIDELSSFKNHQSKRFRSLMKVRPKVKRIVGLTGTPSSNGLMDLWAEYRLLDMGQRLGRFIGQYRSDYFLPDKRNGQVIFTYKPLPNAEKQIYQRIGDITISMNATDHLQMPSLLAVEHKVYLSDIERERYDELKRDLVLQLPGGKSLPPTPPPCRASYVRWQTVRFTATWRGRTRFNDRKLMNWRSDRAGQRQPRSGGLWFQHDKARIMERLVALHIPFAHLDKAGTIERWNQGELPVALIHPASADTVSIASGWLQTLIWFG